MDDEQMLKYLTRLRGRLEILEQPRIFADVSKEELDRYQIEKLQGAINFVVGYVEGGINMLQPTDSHRDCLGSEPLSDHEITEMAKRAAVEN